ncbi:HXXXD-type acyl-transferase family protein, partial [Prunus dulcis]
FSGVEIDPIRGVGCTSVWGDIVILCEVPRGVVSRGVGFSGVETDPICGVGCTSVWGDIMILCEVPPGVGYPACGQPHTWRWLYRRMGRYCDSMNRADNVLGSLLRIIGKPKAVYVEILGNV